MKSRIPDLVALALEAPQERIEQAILVLQGGGLVTTTPIEPLLTASQVAELLNISRMSLHRWKVPSHPLAGKPRFRLSEVIKYLDSDKFRSHAEFLRRTRVFTRKKS